MSDIEIQVINPGDKLIIRIPKGHRGNLEEITKVAVDFMNRDDFKALVFTAECDLYVIKKDAQNRLMKDSLLKTYQISSFDKSRFIKYIGILNTTSMKQVETHIHRFLFEKALDSTKSATTSQAQEPISSPKDKKTET